MTISSYIFSKFIQILILRTIWLSVNSHTIEHRIFSVHSFSHSRIRIEPLNYHTSNSQLNNRLCRIYLHFQVLSNSGTIVKVLGNKGVIVSYPSNRWVLTNGTNKRGAHRILIWGEGVMNAKGPTKFLHNHMLLCSAIFIITFQMLDHFGYQQNSQQEQENVKRNWREINCLVFNLHVFNKYLATS